MIFSLLQLYQSILVPVFSDWISDSDLCYLDTAVTNHHRRKDFLAFLCKSRIHCGGSLLYYGEYCDWVELRSVRLKSIHIRIWMKSEPKLLSLLQSMKNISFLHIEHPSENEIVMLGRGKNIQLLKVNGLQGAEFCAKMLEINNVFSVDISDSSFNRSILQTPEVCRVLRKLTVRANESESVSKIVELYNLDEVTCRLGDICGAMCPSRINSCIVTLVRAQSAHANTWNIAGKMYVLTKLNGLSAYDACVEDLAFLTPYWGHLKTFSFLGSLGRADSEPMFKAVVAANCCSLTSLSLDNKTSFDLTSLFRGCIKLTSLVLTQFKVSDPEVESLATHCPLLEYVDLGQSQVSEKAAVLLLQRSSMLTYFNVLQIVESVDSVLQTVCDIDTIQLVDQSSSFFLSRSDKRSLYRCSIAVQVLKSNCLPSLFALNPNLTKIALSVRVYFNNHTLLSLVSHCPLLQSVELACPFVTSDGLLHLTQLRHLSSLSLRHMRVSVTALESILSEKIITRLELKQCKYDLDSGVVPIVVKYCPLLTRLEISRCPGVTSGDVQMLLELCTRLVYLKVENCVNVTSEVCSVLRSHRQMRYVNLQRCAVKKEALDELEESGFNCSYAFVY